MKPEDEVIDEILCAQNSFFELILMLILMLLIVFICVAAWLWYL